MLLESNQSIIPHCIDSKRIIVQNCRVPKSDAQKSVWQTISESDDSWFWTIPHPPCINEMGHSYLITSSSCVGIKASCNSDFCKNSEVTYHPVRLQIQNLWLLSPRLLLLQSIRTKTT